MKKKIAVDLDGVTWNCHSLLIKIFNEQNGTNHKYESYKCWNFFPEDKFWPAYNELVSRIDEFPMMDKNLGSYFAVLNLVFDIHFLTHGNYTKRIIKEKLEDWFIFEGLDYKSIIIENNDNSKANHDFDYYIDDNPNLTLDIIKHPQKQMLLFDSPWNRSFDCSKYANIKRVKNWSDILAFFDEELINDGKM